ncbi:MAG TPA: DoxX family protein [Candidatus Acidoferrales bacterium]|jgi:putative oxidoreductase|nr:DoxX family protein [Candidatus Acidoferrales bacterium]
MATNSISQGFQSASTSGIHAGTSAGVLSRLTVLAGRALFAAIFLMSAPMHFTAQEIGYASSVGLPLAGLLVPFSGVLALLGGLSILLGYRARVGAWLIVLFLVPVTLIMHKFWGIADPAVAQMQMVMFMKNASMLGAALMFTYLGAGPLSLDARRQR